jgi:dienelactone hydrolase
MNGLVKLFVSALILLTAGGVNALAGGHSSGLDYNSGGKQFSGFVQEPVGTSKGTIIIVHDWDGLTDYEKKRAAMLSEKGYRAVAIDLFGIDAKLDGFEDYRRETGALYRNRDMFRARIDAAITAARKLSSDKEKLFIIGYCFGGAAVLEAARAGMAMSGFVSFHGGLATPEGQNFEKTNAPVLLLHGSADPVSGMDDLASLIKQLQAASVPHDAEIYGGARHSFTIEGSRDYDQAAEAKSWDALMRFLDRNS